MANNNREQQKESLFMKVKNMVNSCGRSIPNQFVITTSNSKTFQSYDSAICLIENGTVTLSDHWDYSRTTLKYLSRFLGGENKKTIQEKINNGTYKMGLAI